MHGILRVQTVGSPSTIFVTSVQVPASDLASRPRISYGRPANYHLGNRDRLYRKHARALGTLSECEPSCSLHYALDQTFTLNRPALSASGIHWLYGEVYVWKNLLRKHWLPSNTRSSQGTRQQTMRAASSKYFQQNPPSV